LSRLNGGGAQQRIMKLAGAPVTTEATAVIEGVMMNTPTTSVPPVTPTPQDDRMSHHLRALAEDAEALLKATARAGDEKYDATRERLRDELHHLRVRLGELESSAAARVKSAARHTDEAVHAHPYSAMGAAALAGLLLGFLMARR
jgi:uncharacterized protein (TIGR03382 family)